jgi:putative aminopeptidase FrvX
MAALQLLRGARSTNWRERLVRPTATKALALLRCPTAPYSESLPLAFIRQWVVDHGWRLKEDQVGNLIVTVPGKSGRKPALAFLAHLDHPAMTVCQVSGTGKVAADFFGGHPGDRMLGAPVRLHSPHGEGRPIKAKVIKVGAKDAKTGCLPLTLEAKRSGVEPGWLGEWDVPYRLSNRLVRNVVCDNLAGAASILAGLALAQRQGLERPIQAWFTRCEENGFVGCLEGLRLGSFSADVPAIVLECSPQLSHVRPGDGPVMRVGDRVSVFDAGLCSALGDVATELANRVPGFKWQRKLMDGGACEATALCSAGFRSACLAMPLRNYHNVPDDRNLKGPYAEEIDRTDQDAMVLWLATLCLNPKAVSAVGDPGLAAKLEKMRKNRRGPLARD